MWYIAGDRWIDLRGKQVPTYNSAISSRMTGPLG